MDTLAPVHHLRVDGIQRATGWDVIDADFPHQIDTQLMYGEADKIAAASYVERRLKELKAKGYQRIIVGGQSIGGWTALVVSTHPHQALDATLLVVPACCAWSYGGGADPANAEFANNKIYFDQLVARVRYPTAAIFFEDEFEPGDRGANASKMLTDHHVANLIIDHPSGFAGHGSAWLPVFDYEFRNCIVAFLQAPRTAQCREHALLREGFPHDFCDRSVRRLARPQIDLHRSDRQAICGLSGRLSLQNRGQGPDRERKATASVSAR